MNKNGGYTWLQTCATVVCSSKNAEEQNIICVNYVVSHRESEHIIMDCIQLENGLDNIIKHEDAQHLHVATLGGHDGTIGSAAAVATTSSVNLGATTSPSNTDAVADVEHQLAHIKTPKSETPEPKTRSARNAAAVAAAAAVVSASVTASSATVGETGSADSEGNSQHTTPARKAHKRKIKTLDHHQTTDEISAGVEKQQHTTEASPPVAGRLPMSGDGQPESSVKDLEHAMSKHLPSPVGGVGSATPTAAVVQPTATATTTTDFSTDALLKEQQDKSSTIQWIGAHHHQQHHHHHSTFHHHQQNAPMPATALLRQLYANRESVIRATARQGPNGVFYGEFHGILIALDLVLS